MAFSCGKQQTGIDCCSVLKSIAKLIRKEFVMTRPILEIKEYLDGRRKEFPCTLLSLAADKAVILYRMSHAAQIENVKIPAKALSLGYYWTDRLYNVYHWSGPRRTDAWPLLQH